jgi:hypothetical protein
MIRREVADTLRFDERYVSYVEDVDFCCRARDRGWHVARVGAAHASTSGSVDPQMARVLMQANTLVFFGRRRDMRRFAGRCWLLVRGAVLGGQDRVLYLKALGLGIWRLCSFAFQSGPAEPDTPGEDLAG